MGGANKKSHIWMYLAMILLCLVCISSGLTSGLYARYASSIAGDDSARVASFKVTVSGKVKTEDILLNEQINLGTLAPGESVTIEFKVTNESEVSVALEVTAANLTGNLPLNVPLKGTPEAEQPMFSETLQPGETKTLEYQISWDDEKSNPTAAGKTDVLDLRIMTVQVD